MSLTICEINLHLNWSKNWVTVATFVANKGATFSVPDSNLYVPLITLSTQDNSKPSEQLKSELKRTINWSK